MGKKKGKGPGPAPPRSKPTSESDSGNVPSAGSANIPGSTTLPAASTVVKPTPATTPTATPTSPVTAPTLPTAAMPTVSATTPSTSVVIPTVSTTVTSATSTVPIAPPTVPTAVVGIQSFSPVAPVAPLAPITAGPPSGSIPSTAPAVVKPPTTVGTVTPLVPSATVPSTVPAAILSSVPAAAPPAPVAVPLSTPVATSPSSLVAAPPSASTVVSPSVPVEIAPACTKVPPPTSAAAPPSASATASPSEQVAVAQTTSPVPVTVPSVPTAFTYPPISVFMPTEGLKTDEPLIFSPQTKSITPDTSVKPTIQSTQSSLTGSPAVPKKEPQQIKQDNSNILSGKEEKVLSSSSTLTSTDVKQETQVKPNVPSENEKEGIQKTEFSSKETGVSFSPKNIEATVKKDIPDLKLVEIQRQTESTCSTLESQVPKEKVGAKTQPEERVPQKQKSPQKETQTKVKQSEIPKNSVFAAGTQIEICPVDILPQNIEKSCSDAASVITPLKVDDTGITTPKEQNTKSVPEKSKSQQKPELPKKPPGLMQMKGTKPLHTQSKSLDAQMNNENKQEISQTPTVKSVTPVSANAEEIKKPVSLLPMQVTSESPEKVKTSVEVTDKSLANQKDQTNEKSIITTKGDVAKDIIKENKDIKHIDTPEKLQIFEQISQPQSQSTSQVKTQESHADKSKKENDKKPMESVTTKSDSIIQAKTSSESITDTEKDVQDSSKENTKKQMPIKIEKNKISGKQNVTDKQPKTEAPKNVVNTPHEQHEEKRNNDKLNANKSQDQQSQKVSSQKETQKSQNQAEGSHKQAKKGKDEKQKEGKNLNKPEVTKVDHTTEVPKTVTENSEKDVQKESTYKEKTVPKPDIKPSSDSKSKHEKSNSEKSETNKGTENTNKDVSRAKEGTIKSNESKKSLEKTASEKVLCPIPTKENTTSEPKKGSQMEKSCTETEINNKQTKDVKKDASKTKTDNLEKKDDSKIKLEQEKQKPSLVSQKEGTKVKEEKQKSEQKPGPEKSNEEKKKSPKQTQQKDVTNGKESGESQTLKAGNESVKVQKGTTEKENKVKSGKLQAEKGVSEKGKGQSKKVDSKTTTEKGKVDKENVSKPTSKPNKKLESSSSPKVSDEKKCSTLDASVQKTTIDEKGAPKVHSTSNPSINDDKSETPVSLLTSDENSATVAKKKRRRKKKKPADGVTKGEILEDGKQDSSTQQSLDSKQIQGNPTQGTTPQHLSTIKIITATNNDSLDNKSTANLPSEKGEFEVFPAKKKKNKRKKKQSASGNESGNVTGTSVASNELSFPKKNINDFGKSNLTINRLAHHLSNCCCVCKSTGNNNSPVLTCSACSLACYCGREHQVQHWPEHKEFCNYICTVLSKERPYFFSPAEKMNHDERRQFKLSELQLCQTTLNRVLTPLESALILHPRACFTCYKPVFQNVCTNCHCINYCSLEHLPPDHKIWCDTLRIKLLFVQSQKEHGSAGISVPKPSKICYPMNSNMKEYLQTLDFVPPNNMAKDLYNAHISELATYPLTLLHALQLLATQGATNPLQYEHLVVHVVGAEDVYECCQMLKWKYFFVNLLPKIKTLHLVFIGCELSIDDEKVHVEGRLVYEFHAKMTYLDYCKKCYIKPSIVCAFNSGLYRSTGYKGSDSWGPSLTPMLNMNHGAPLLLTAYTHMEAQLDLQRLKEIFLNKLHVVQQPLKNPYASIFPNHNLVSEHECPVAFRNYFMTIVRHA